MEDPPKLEVGAYDAKTRLPELLRQVREGRSVTITHRGRPVADLVPHGSASAPNAAAAIDAYLAFRAAHPAPSVPSIRALIEDGRE
jgi:prevent-host-death family protein